MYDASFRSTRYWGEVFSSEVQAEGELHDPGCPRGEKLAEARINLVALGVESGRCIERGELGVIEGVVSFDPELHPNAFGDGQILHE